MKFSEIIGQKPLSARMRKAIRDGRVPHAQLFLGQEGSGNLALALAYSQYAHCTQRTEDDSCGECSSCRKHLTMTHPDMHFSFPFPSNKADIASELYAEWRKAILQNPYQNYELWMQALESENKQGNIPIKECHAIIKSLSLKPFEGEYKILLMWLPEYLGSEGNVLLKLLEEPPPQTLFLLVAENPEKIINTILSRVQLTRIPPIESQFIAEVLKSKFELTDTEANRIALLSGGNYLRAIELSANVQNEYLEPFRNWMGYCYQKKMAQAMAWSEEYGGNGREQIKGFFLYSLEIIRAVAVLPYAQISNGLSAEETTFTNNFSKVIKTHAQAELIYNWFNDAAYEIERNGNAKMILTDLSFKLARILK